eukprot:1107828-Pelagomonas_calceolata.AAC.3
MSLDVQAHARRLEPQPTIAPAVSTAPACLLEMCQALDCMLRVQIRWRMVHDKWGARWPRAACCECMLNRSWCMTNGEWDRCTFCAASACQMEKNAPQEGGWCMKHKEQCMTNGEWDG